MKRRAGSRWVPLVLLAGGLTLAACSSDDKPTKPIAIYGDSLTYGAQSYLEAAADDAEVAISVTGVPGAALCDLRSEIEQTLRDHPPAALVLVFAGNNSTPCAGGRVGAPLVDLYAEDATAIVALAAEMGVPVVLAGPPAIEPEPWATTAELLNDQFRTIADQQDDVAYLDLGEVLSPQGFTTTLPCLTSEGAAQGCSHGEIVVRNPDGVHFDDPGPDGYSSGSYRFAQAVFAAGEDAA
jgi:GDSL-like Lipase/Acylhydrolase family